MRRAPQPSDTLNPPRTAAPCRLSARRSRPAGGWARAWPMTILLLLAVLLLLAPLAARAQAVV